MKPRGSLRFHWLAPLVGVYLGAWMVRRMWGPGLIGGADSTAIVNRTDRTIHDVFARGHLNGWSPYFSIGHDAFLINPPGFSAIIAAIRVLSFGQLSTAGAIKVAVLLSFVALPTAVAACARSLGADRRVASLAGILSVTVTVFAGFGVRGVFETGLYPFQVAAPLFFFALAAIVNTACDPSPRRATIAALWIAALLLTHILMATVLVYCASAALLAMFLGRRATFGFASCSALLGAGIGAAALSAVWLYPFADDRHLAGRAATWSPPTFHEEIADVVHGRRLYDKPLAHLVIVGWIFVVAVGLRGRRRGLIPCAIAAASFVAVHAVRGVFPNDVTSQMPWRALTSIGVIALIPAATMIAMVTGWLATGLRKAGDHIGPVATVARHHLLVAEVIGVAFCMVVVFGVDHRTHLDGELPEPIPEMRATAQLLHSLVPESGRFAVEEDFPAEIGRLGVIAPARWLAWASGRNELNLFNPELNRGAAGYAAREIRTTDTGLAFHLATLGVSFVVSTSEETATRLSLDQEMTLLETRGPLRIWQIHPEERAIPNALVSVELGSVTANYERRSNEHHRFSVDVTEHTAVGIAIAYSPRWKLTVDGHSVTPDAYSDGRIKLALDPGHHDIRLDYASDWRTIVGGIVSILALVYAARILFFWPRQKVSGAPPNSSS